MVAEHQPDENSNGGSSKALKATTFNHWWETTAVDHWKDSHRIIAKSNQNGEMLQHLKKGGFEVLNGKRRFRWQLSKWFSLPYQTAK